MQGNTARFFNKYGLVVGVYIIATLVTTAYRMKDTVEYAEAIQLAQFKDFGHFLWFPLGYFFFKILMPLARLIEGFEPLKNIVLSLIIINWIAGLLSVIVMRRLADFVTKKAWPADFIVIGYCLSFGFLNHTQTGCSYVPGNLFMLLSLFLLIQQGFHHSHKFWPGIAAGLAMAVGVTMWAPYIFAVPGVLLAPLILYGHIKPWVSMASRSIVFFCILASLIYIFGAINQNIHSVTEAKAWIQEDAGGLADRTGLPRVALGISRTMLDIDNYNIILKRFRYHDPYNPVSLSGLFHFSLLKIFIVFIFCGIVLIHLMRTKEGRRILLVLSCYGIPILAFGFFWQGAEPERYQALVPIFFLSVGYLFGQKSISAFFKFLVVLCVLFISISNLWLMAKPLRNPQIEAEVKRIYATNAIFNSESIFISIPKDNIFFIIRDYSIFHKSMYPYNGFFYPYNGIFSLSLNSGWKHALTRKILSVWERGGDVWISKRFLISIPKFEWDWVEGEFPGLKWADLYGFFSLFEYSKSIGNKDGFILLLRSSQNARIIYQQKDI